MPGGGIIKEEAILKGLESGKVASAGLDVFEIEPARDNPLFKHNNVVVTPHLGADTFEAQKRVGENIAEQVIMALRGEIVPNVVNLPTMLGEELEYLKPYISLSEKMGSVYYQLTRNPISRVDARLRILSSSSRVLKNWNRIRFHLGTDETMARVVLLDGDELHPGQEGYVQIVMEKPVVGHKGDPFVIRYYSPVSTIGGGTIIDANASKQKRFREETLNQLIVKEEGNLSEMILYELEANPQDVISVDELARRLGNDEDRIRQELGQMSIENKVVELKKDEYMSTFGLGQLADKIIMALQEYHLKYPLRQGPSREEIRSRFSKNVNSKTFNLILKELEADKKIEIQDQQIRMPGHEPSPGERELQVIQLIKSRMKENLFTPPSVESLREAAGIEEDDLMEILAYLTKEKVLVKINPEIF